jgi:hypothetical protein
MAPLQDPAAEAAIRAGNDVFAADNRRVPQNAVGDELRVFDKVGSGRAPSLQVSRRASSLRLASGIRVASTARCRLESSFGQGSAY